MRLSKRIVGIVLCAALCVGVGMPIPASAKYYTGGTQVEFNGQSTQGRVDGYESFFRSMAFWIVAAL